MAQIRDEEDGTLRAASCCAPLAALRRPVEVEDLFDSGYWYVRSPISLHTWLSSPL